jgi:hypothetical protein
MDTMAPTMKSLGVDRMTSEERIALALEIWTSLGETRPRGQLSSEQGIELARRD